MTRLLERALREIERLPASEQDAAACALMDYLAYRKLAPYEDAFASFREWSGTNDEKAYAEL